MRYAWDKEYEARVRCEHHGEVWALVTRRYRHGEPEACECPQCGEEMTFAATLGPGQVRERDPLADLTGGAAGDYGLGAVGGDDDDGQ